nr:hypothetical protein [Spinactinospora alkalitolerans]
MADLGAAVAIAEIADDDRPPYAARYVARAALEIGRAALDPPVLLVAAGAAGPLLPQIGAAQRAAHRALSGYVLLDAPLPQPGTPTRAEIAAAQLRDAPGEPDARSRPPEFFTEPLPMPQDWPDAPCGYLLTDARHADCAHLAALRGWPVADLTTGRTGAGGPADVAAALLGLVDAPSGPSGPP